MIDWLNLAANALWVLGCAIALAVLSYTSWEASHYHEKMAARLRRPAAQAVLNLAGLLFFLGLGLVNKQLLPRSLYFLLALLFLALMLASFRGIRKTAPPNSP